MTKCYINGRRKVLVNCGFEQDTLGQNRRVICYYFWLLRELRRGEKMALREMSSILGLSPAAVSKDLKLFGIKPGEIISGEPI